MLQNRVDPQGNLIITPARGEWMGNRGQLHGEGKSILRPFRLKAWLICLLEFKERHRPVMSPNQYTELFFLDEATAFAAGHRPCFECRRRDYDLFKSSWLTGNPEYGFSNKTSIQHIDEVLHGERIDEAGRKQIYKAKYNDLPEGVFIRVEEEPFLIADHKIHRWTPFGYEEGRAFSSADPVSVLTPRSTVNAFLNGYRPQWHQKVNGIQGKDKNT